MKAAILEGIKKIRIREIPIPQISENEVLIKIKEVSLCSSDLHYYNEGRLNKRKVTDSFILGHESSGIIEKIGANVHNLKVGDRVAIEPGVPCLRCEFCKSGKYNECKNLIFLSAPPNDGTLAEYIKYDSNFVHKIPENISFSQAALIEPLSVGYYAVMRADIKPGDNVCILGCGPIGLACLEMARISGAAKIFITDTLDYRLIIARAHGAFRTINILNTNLNDVIIEETEGNGVEKVIESSGTESAIRQSLEIVKNCGTIVWVGMGKNEITIPYIETIYKDLTIKGVFRYVNTYGPLIKLIERGAINFEGILSHRFKFEDIQKAIDTANDQNIEKVKIIIYM